MTKQAYYWEREGERERERERAKERKKEGKDEWKETDKGFIEWPLNDSSGPAVLMTAIESVSIHLSQFIFEIRTSGAERWGWRGETRKKREQQEGEKDESCNK